MERASTGIGDRDYAFDLSDSDGDVQEVARGEQLSRDPFSFDPRLQRVREHLLVRIDQPFPLKMAAALACLEEHYFCTLFSREVGMSFSEWRTQCRIARALQLLQSQRMQISVAARAVGYVDSSSFSRAFRKTYGITPQSFVRAMRSKNASYPSALVAMNEISNNRVIHEADCSSGILACSQPRDSSIEPK